MKLGETMILVHSVPAMLPRDSAPASPVVALMTFDSDAQQLSPRLVTPPVHALVLLSPTLPLPVMLTSIPNPKTLRSRVREPGYDGEKIKLRHYQAVVKGCLEGGMWTPTLMDKMKVQDKMSCRSNEG